MAIDKFELPRLDWHDAEGRIYKDALIENFNAIEAKLIELSGLTPLDIILPDISNMTYEDVTLASQDNKVVNLKSFVDIMQIMGFPLDCEFNGKTLARLDYYDEEYKRKTLTDVKLDNLGTNGKNYVYLDYSGDTVYVSDDNSNPNGDILIGVYADGIIYGSSKGKGYIDVNVLQLLSRMQFQPQLYQASGRGRKVAFSADGSVTFIGYGGKDQQWLDADCSDYGKIIREAEED